MDSGLITRETERRRTFAIISHPDAGKTTLTEKLLLYGGAIHLAGAVKAKANQRHTTSDWMEIERQRGISISSSVLQFEFEGCRINLLDTPGHKDFSEDTYRTLTAADSAVMLIDAAKGVEAQTRKLFEVCRMRGIPIFTFMNKLDRPSRDPLDLLDELEKVLGIRSCPMTWPVGMGDRFRGVYDRQRKELLLFQTESEANVKGRLAPRQVTGASDPNLISVIEGPNCDRHDAEELHKQFISEVELLEHAGDAYDHARVLRGELSPVFFGSAMNNFGVERFLQSFLQMAPPPTARSTVEGKSIEPTSKEFSSFVFKIQANMNPSHRDRVAFMRVCSGHFTRNHQTKHARLKKPVKLANPLQFLAQERVIVEDAWPGDIVGLLDTSGDLRIGDTLCDSGGFSFLGVPTFSPENFAQVQILDPMKRKQLKKGVDQLSEEGVIQVYQQRGHGDKDPILGAVGQLQFEVFKFRVQNEYGVNIQLQKLPFTLARWIVDASFPADEFDRREGYRAVVDRDGFTVLLFSSEWNLRWATEHYKNTTFYPTAPLKQAE
jgi:peptide chain release factor 3